MGRYLVSYEEVNVLTHTFEAESEEEARQLALEFDWDYADEQDSAEGFYIDLINEEE